MARQPRVSRPIIAALRCALTQDALPGETAGFTQAAQREAAAFLAAIAASRAAGRPNLRIESLGGAIGQRRMRIGIVNDDMPFLVDSVAGAIAARHLSIHRLLHPVLAVGRSGGRLTSIDPAPGDAQGRESMIYIEVDRADARARAALGAEILAVLADVRAAVRDWPAIRQRMLDDSDRVADAEGAALLRWFADGALTLLGYHVERPGKLPARGLGILGSPGAPTDDGGCMTAIRHFREGGAEPLIAKADRRSTVHRRVPLDLVVVPVRDGGTIAAIGVYAALWTSQALLQPAEEVPLLRRRLDRLHREFGFDPGGHSGKALRHAAGALPRDLLVGLDYPAVKQLVVTAMSLADRPRPTLLMVRSILKGHLFAFVWLPREDLSTRRRLAIGAMIERAVGCPISSWSSELGEGDLAVLRFMLYADPAARLPRAETLEAQLLAMVRGWEPSVEQELQALAGSARATRLALAYLPGLPDEYRSRTHAAEAAADILRLARLGEGRRHEVRLVIDQGDRGAAGLRVKIYRRGGLIALSEAVPVLENFGLRVMEEVPTQTGGAAPANIHDFLVELAGSEAGALAGALAKRAATVEQAIAAVLDGEAENDAFNQLLLLAGLEPEPVVWLRSWFRYLRQTGVAYGLDTVVAALRRAPRAAAALVERFIAAHAPAAERGRAAAVTAASARFDEALHDVGAIDDDRILRLLRALVAATLRTNAFAPAGREALAFKIDGARLGFLPAPVPWREIWVYSPRVEGIHLRGGPIARGGIRWSDRRDDFRTEILGLMKAQMVKNAVIVPTGAKGGFYPKHLPDGAQREAWLAEGRRCYRLFIRALLSITDNIVGDKPVHPADITVHDGTDPYFVVAADKGTASFSDIANAIALEHDFWLGDAFASGGSNGYDHKAMGITARGAWLSVERHFREMGVDVASDPVRAVGCGDMSGDVFGNGMLRSKSLRLIAAFDHRHIFIDPDPDPASAFTERARLFALAGSSWDDYDRRRLSKGGGIYPRSLKSIRLPAEARAALGIERPDPLEPAELIRAILASPVDLIWFGGIGTYIKASGQPHSAVGDPANEALRIDAGEVRTRVIAEGANLAITQAGRIEFAAGGGRINTDFIDNSGGVDCSDNEVNIKIALNRDMREGKLTLARRNALLRRMTGDVAQLVLEDNRLQALALSIAEHRGPQALPNQVRSIELLEAAGYVDRWLEGLEPSQALLRRAHDGRGLTRPELAVLLSLAKLALQDAAELLGLSSQKILDEQLFAAFPPAMRRPHAAAIRGHALADQIIATKAANRLVNRLGPSVALELTEEEGVSLGQMITAFLVAEQLLGLDRLWPALDQAQVSEQARIEMFHIAAASVRSHIADILRAAGNERGVAALCELFAPGLKQIGPLAGRLIRAEVRSEAAARRERLAMLGADDDLADRLVRLYQLDGVFGLAALAARRSVDGVRLTRAYTRLGEALGIDWVQGAVARFVPADQWERLLVAGLARDLEAVRIDFLGRSRGDDPEAAVERWVAGHGEAIERFRQSVAASRGAGSASAAMLAQLTNQARVLLSR